MAESQGNGLGTDTVQSAQDRTDKVLNYPGLTHFFNVNEQRYIRSVNGITPDENGNVAIAGGGESGGTTVFSGDYVESVNGASGKIRVTPSNIGAVPQTRRVNSKQLRTDITLSASDILMTSSGLQTVYDAIINGVAEKEIESHLEVITIRPSDWRADIQTIQIAASDDADLYYSAIPNPPYDATKCTSTVASIYAEYEPPNGKIVDFVWMNQGDLPAPTSQDSPYVDYEKVLGKRCTVDFYNDASHGNQVRLSDYFLVNETWLRQASQVNPDAYVIYGYTYTDTTKEDREIPIPESNLYIVVRVEAPDSVNPVVEHKTFGAESGYGDNEYSEASGAPIDNLIDVYDGKGIITPLWVNQDLNSGVFQETSVTVQHLSDYAFIDILHHPYAITADKADLEVISRVKVGGLGSLTYSYGDSSNSYAAERTVETQNETNAVIFGAGKYHGTTDHRVCRPIAIFGVNIAPPKGDKGDKGDRGETGYSPVVTVEPMGNGLSITVANEDGYSVTEIDTIEVTWLSNMEIQALFNSEGLLT